MKKIFLFLLFCLSIAIALNFALMSPALAIPSPDVVVGLFASASQLLVVLTAVLGGIGFSQQRKVKGKSSSSQRLGTWQKGLFWGVLIVLLLSLGANLLQYAAQSDRDNSRLRANLVRSSTEEGQKVGDTSLKTLSFSEQLQHPRGISTEELASQLAANPNDLNIIDVREPEEVESGQIPGSQQIQYPELLRDPDRAFKQGKENVLLCYSGNRSSELCEKLTAWGIPCNFVVGGYEKWIAEGRPLDLGRSQTRKTLRDLPNYPNKNVLLDTPDVQRLVKDKDALFVDVRYPGDFKLGHLPDAINIPLRKLTPKESKQQIEALPKRPIIAACYDKRSCFYSSILGLRLDRAGYDFLGRYTVPHEYLAPKAEKAHVAQWMASSDRTLLGMASQPLQQLLRWLNSKVGHLAFAIFLLVLILRVGTFPLTLKGERDRILLDRLAPKVAKLKAELRDNPQRLSRSLMGLYRKHRLTPSLNLVGTLVQVFVFLLAFRAVNRVAQSSLDGFLWIPQLSAPDPLLILPLLLGGLTIAHLQLISQKQRRWVSVCLHGLAGVFLFAITFKLSAAVSFYLVVSIGLMMLQHQVLSRVLSARKPIQASFGRDRSPLAAKPIAPAGVVPLRLAHRVPGAGTKAIRLAQLMDAGFAVPDGFVLTYTLLACSKARLKLSQTDWQQINLQWRRLNADCVAVRSSGANEDGADQSYAGMFASVLNVTWEGFHYAIEEVYASRRSQRVNAYSDAISEAKGGILVQEMVAAEFAGVLFTEHPAEKTSLLVEVISGLAEDLVSGKVTPHAYRFGRFSGQLLDSETPPLDLAPLIEIGQKVEKLFGKPQDIEWAYRDGQFFLLQARDITAPLNHIAPECVQRHGKVDRQDLFEREKRRLLELAAGAQPDEVVFAQNELSELLPQPTPLSLSLMESLWQAGGTTDLACRELGLPYNVAEDASPAIATLFGRLYINKPEEKRRLSGKPGPLASLRLIRTADRLEQQYRQDFLPAFLRQVRLKEALDFAQLTTEELFELVEEWHGQFVRETYVQAHLINIAADFSLKLAQRELTRRQLNPATYLSQIPETVVHQAMSLLPKIREGQASLSEFLNLFGHRSPYDFELAQPRYSESPQLVEQLLETASFSSFQSRSDAPPLPPSKPLTLALERARNFQSLKEEAKHNALRELAVLRRLLVALDRRLELDGGIFYYTFAELPQLRDDLADLQDAKARKAKHQATLNCLKSCRLPSQLTLSQLEALSLNRDRQPKRARTGTEALQGTLVAGQAPIEGRAQVILNAEDIGNFQPGNILVTRFTHPNWTPVFPLAAAAITEVGGWLSHAAIVAREYNVPTIVGVRGILDQVETGDRLRLNPDGSIEHNQASDRPTTQSA